MLLWHLDIFIGRRTPRDVRDVGNRKLNYTYPLVNRHHREGLPLTEYFGPKAEPQKAPEFSKPIQEPRVASVASQCILAQPTPILSLSDKVQHQQYAESSDQARLVSTADLNQPFQPQNHSIMSSDWYSEICNTNDDYDRIGGIAPQSDVPHGVAQPALSKTPSSGCCPVSPKRRFTEADLQHKAVNDMLPLVSLPSPLPNHSRLDKERQTSTNARHDMSPFRELFEEIAKRPSRRRGYRKTYNLRPLQVKRQFIGELDRSEGEEACVAQQKRRKVMSPQQGEHELQQGESELSRKRKPRVLGKKMTKNSDNATVANTKRPSHFSAASYQEWSLAHSILKCTRENETATFQLQFTSDSLWKALTAQNDRAPKDHQSPNNVRGRMMKIREEQLNQHTETVAQQSIQAAYPSVCPDIYRMDSLLARWRQHSFLVKWSDATMTWEPRKHIIDKEELRRFEASWQGFDAGVDILGVRLRAGKHQHLLHWHGRPSKEDTWVDDEFLSSNLLGRI